MLSPNRYTTAWSDTAAGLVRKKKASVRWKREREVMIVRADMSAILGCFLSFESQIWSSIESRKEKWKAFCSDRVEAVLLFPCSGPSWRQSSGS